MSLLFSDGVLFCPSDCLHLSGCLLLFSSVCPCPTVCLFACLLVLMACLPMSFFLSASLLPLLDIAQRGYMCKRNCPNQYRTFLANLSATMAKHANCLQVQSLLVISKDLCKCEDPRQCEICHQNCAIDSKHSKRLSSISRSYKPTHDHGVIQTKALCAVNKTLSFPLCTF